VEAAVLLLLEGVGGTETGGAEKPPGEAGVAGETGGLLGDEDEDGLGDVFGEVGVTYGAAGGGIDPVDVALDEFRKGGLAFVAEEGLQQLAIGHGMLLSLPHVRRREKGTWEAGILAWWQLAGRRASSFVISTVLLSDCGDAIFAAIPIDESPLVRMILGPN
jgi:hypothetical protein